MKRGINKAVGIIILVAGLAAIAGAIAYGIWYANANPSPYLSEKRSKGTVLYRKILEYDLENEYPENAEDIMELNNLIMELCYGEIIADNELVYELVEIQRKLFSESLLESRTAEEQAEGLIAGTQVLYDNGVNLYDASTGTIWYSDDNETCIVPITQAMIKYENFYWNYFLRKDDEGRWKIFTYERTDKSFREHYVD